MTKRDNYNQWMNDYMKQRWAKRRAAAVHALGGCCARCGSTDALEFDHIDPSTKEFTIAKASSFSETRFQSEISKCQLLCRTCHIVKTAEDNASMS